jgi:hypothetical protein
MSSALPESDQMGASRWRVWADRAGVWTILFAAVPTLIGIFRIYLTSKGDYQAFALFLGNANLTVTWISGFVYALPILIVFATTIVVARTLSQQGTRAARSG